MQKWARSKVNSYEKSGFTIVELLIVVVVIAILAAITIVAYNGIQNRAKDSALSSAASQAGRKVLTYAPLNADQYPDEANFRSLLSLPDDTSTAKYDYYTSTNRRAFCISVTNTSANPVTAYAMTESGKTVSGQCIENLIANPSFEATNGSLVPGITASSRVTVDSSDIGVIDGTKSVRVAATYSSSRDTFADLSNWGLQANKTYTMLITYTLPDPLPVGGPRFRFNIASIDANSSVGSGAAGSRSISWTFSTNSGVTPISFLRLMPGSLLGEPATYFDSLMAIEGDRQMQYGDGTYPNWSWVGTPHASASFGPSQPR